MEKAAASLAACTWAEILTQAGLRLGWRPAGVYQRIANPFVDRYVSAVRAPFYPGGLMQKSPLTAVALMRYAREGGGVALLADQREGRGVTAPFFGKPAPSNPFPALVARSVDAPLYVFCAKRLNGVRFSVSITQVTAPLTGDRDADIEAATRNLQATLELMIRDAPDQWMWIHRRWGVRVELCRTLTPFAAQGLSGRSRIMLMASGGNAKLVCAPGRPNHFRRPFS